jgi:hypothetical protein
MIEGVARGVERALTARGMALNSPLEAVLHDAIATGMQRYLRNNPSALAAASARQRG